MTQPQSADERDARAKRAQRPERIDPAQAYYIAEACAALGISRAQYYALVQRNVIRPITVLGAPRVSGAEIIRLTSGGDSNASAAS